MPRIKSFKVLITTFKVAPVLSKTICSFERGKGSESAKSNTTTW